MRLLLLTLLALALSAGAARPVRAESDPCNGYKWDLSRERALFGTAAQEAPAGKDRATATVVVPNRLYELTLTPVVQVSFPVTPGKTPPSGSYAGIVSLSLPGPGKYRIAADLPLWIDVTAGSALVPAVDYEGLHGCSAPRKVVVFDLAGKSDWLMQISAADRALVRLTLTPVR